MSVIEHTHEMGVEYLVGNLINVHQQDCECGMYRLVNYTVDPTHYSPWMGQAKEETLDPANKNPKEEGSTKS